MSNEKSSGGVGFTSLLLIAFIVLKLCGVITWSWWWVLSPAWITAGLAIIGLAIYGVAQYFKAKDTKERIKSGYHEQAWKNGGKSRWQQRLDEMQKKQEEMERRQKVGSN